MDTKHELRNQVNNVINQIEWLVDDSELEDYLDECDVCDVEELEGEELENAPTTYAQFIENEILDIESIHISPRGGIQGATLLYCYGGSTIIIDTKAGDVIGMWGGDRIEFSYHAPEFDCYVDELCQSLVEGMRW